MRTDSAMQIMLHLSLACMMECLLMRFCQDAPWSCVTWQQRGELNCELVAEKVISAPDIRRPWSTIQIQHFILIHCFEKYSVYLPTIFRSSTNSPQKADNRTGCTNSPQKAEHHMVVRKQSLYHVWWNIGYILSVSSISQMLEQKW